MPETDDTVVTEPVVTETPAPEVNGTEVDASTTTDEPTGEPERVDTPDPAEVERLRKENQKLQMEINQRRNKEKELETARERAEREALEKEGKWQELAEKLQAEKEAQAQAERQREQQKEVDEFRDKIIADYPTEVQDLAKKLGTNWDDAADYGTAETQLRSKLEVLKEAVVTSTGEDAPQIHSNNPAPSRELTELDKLRQMSAAEMRKVLPIADK
jgi:rRNA maturation endonuclease Nob1